MKKILYAMALSLSFLSASALAQAQPTDQSCDVGNPKPCTPKLYPGPEIIEITNVAKGNHYICHFGDMKNIDIINWVGNPSSIILTRLASKVNVDINAQAAAGEGIITLLDKDWHLPHAITIQCSKISE